MPNADKICFFYNQWLSSHHGRGHICQLYRLLLRFLGPRVVRGGGGGRVWLVSASRVTVEELWAGGTGPSELLAPVSLNHAFPLGFLLNPKFPEKVEGRFSAAPLVDLSLSPPSGLDSPNGSSSLSPERQGNGDLPAVPTGPVRRGCVF